MSVDKKQLQGELKLSELENLPYVAIIILNWNGWENTIECLESIQHLSYSNYDVILVDNGSTDNSVQKIKEWCSGNIPVNSHYVKFSLDLKPVTYLEYDKTTAEKGGIEEKESRFNNIPSNRKIIIIQTGENLGFPGGNNVAMKYALKREYEYMWLLNNDVVVDKMAVTELVKCGENFRNVGMLGSKIFYYYKPDQICSFGNNRLLWPIQNVNKDSDIEMKCAKVKWIGGASMLVKRAVIEQIELLDEKYFLYGEEKDWCIRASRKGWKIYRVPNSKVWHKIGASTKYKRTEKRFLKRKVTRLSSHGYIMCMYYDVRNGLYFIKKNFPQYFVLYFILRTLHLIGQVILYDDQKSHRIKTILIGVWDGLTGKMGKKINPLSHG